MVSLQKIEDLLNQNKNLMKVFKHIHVNIHIKWLPALLSTC